MASGSRTPARSASVFQPRGDRSTTPDAAAARASTQFLRIADRPYLARPCLIDRDSRLAGRQCWRIETIGVSRSSAARFQVARADLVVGFARRRGRHPAVHLPPHDRGDGQLQVGGMVACALEMIRLRPAQQTCLSRFSTKRLRSVIGRSVPCMHSRSTRPIAAIHFSGPPLMVEWTFWTAQSTTEARDATRLVPFVGSGSRVSSRSFQDHADESIYLRCG
jgi:hypothetical protein